MITKNDIRDLILKECDICLHLAAQIPEGGMDYTPSEGQRTTLELLRYVSFCSIGAARMLVDGHWEAYQAMSEAAKTMTADEFPAAMASQKDQISAFFDEVTQEQLDTQMAKTPMGEDIRLDLGLVSMAQHWLVAYRMQLFLYVKQAGNNDIWTPDCWMGVSMDKPVPAEADA